MKAMINVAMPVLALSLSSTAQAQTSAELVIRSEQACALRINGRDEGQLASGTTHTIGVKPGDLLVECDAGRGQRVEKVLKAAPGESAVALLTFGPYERYSLVADGVLDREERIVWAASDNGSQISWEGAKTFCGAKGSRWRLPKPGELHELNDESGRNKRRFSNPYEEWWDIEASLVTPLIRWTTPCFHHDANENAQCLGDVVMKPGKRGLTGFNIANPKNKRALCVRDDGARGHAGFELEHVSEFESRRLRLPQIGGARITSIQPDGPAASAGLLMGDIVIGLDGAPIGNAGQLQLLIQRSEPTRTATFSIFRDGQTLTIPVVLGSRE